MSVVIQVEHLSKYYRLGLIGGGTLREDLNRWWAKLRGQPDPLRRIGESDHGNRKDGQLWALRDINLQVKQGEILGIIGRNGAGKSTLLKILSRITAPTEGRVKIMGRVGSLLEVGTGFHPELTGRENIYLNGTILGMTRPEVTRKLDEIVEFAEMAQFIDTPVKRYSSGMTVRLAFAVAAHLEPEILIIDEVLAVGDANFQRKCIGKMHLVADHGRTVLFVSHNMNSIQSLCKNVVCLEAGSIKEIGGSNEIVGRYLAQSFKATQDRVLPDGYIYVSGETKERKNAEIIGIQLLDSKGKAVIKIGTWEEVTIRIHYRMEEDVRRGSIVLKVETIDGQVMILTSTQPDFDIPMVLKRGEHSADCVFRQWPLSEGTYRLGAGLAIPMVEYLCWTDDLCVLNTVGRDVFKAGMAPSSRRYLVAAAHHWKI